MTMRIVTTTFSPLVSWISLLFDSVVDDTIQQYQIALCWLRQIECQFKLACKYISILNVSIIQDVCSIFISNMRNSTYFMICILTKLGSIFNPAIKKLSFFQLILDIYRVLAVHVTFTRQSPTEMENLRI